MWCAYVIEFYNRDVYKLPKGHVKGNYDMWNY